MNLYLIIKNNEFFRYHGKDVEKFKSHAIISESLGLCLELDVIIQGNETPFGKGNWAFPVKIEEIKYKLIK